MHVSKVVSKEVGAEGYEDVEGHLFAQNPIPHDYIL